MLGPDDPLPCPVDRIVVAGPSGAGKTTLCRTISALLNVPTIEIDSLYHGPEWTPRADFVADVDRFTAGPRWVIEWGYRLVKPLLRERATLLVWLNHPRHTVLWRVVWRTVHRRLGQRELWNGNQEQALWRVLIDPDHIVRWSWRVYGKYPTEIPALLDTPGCERLTIVRLVGQRQVDAWLAGPFAAARTARPNQEVPSSPPEE